MRLAAGGKRIRTLGPTLTKVSAGVLPKGDPGTTGWGPVLSSGPLARWRLAARPLRGPYTARPRFRISFAPAESPNFRCRSLGTTPEFETTFLPQPEYNCVPIPNQAGNRERGGAGKRCRRASAASAADSVAEVTSADLNPDAICCMTCSGTDGGDAG